MVMDMTIIMGIMDMIIIMGMIITEVIMEDTMDIMEDITDTIDLSSIATLIDSGNQSRHKAVPSNLFCRSSFFIGECNDINYLHQ